MQKFKFESSRFQPYALRVATENDYHGGMGDPMLRYGAVNAREAVV